MPACIRPPSSISTRPSTWPSSGSTVSPSRRLASTPNDASRGTQAAVLGYPGGGPFTVDAAGIMAQFEAEGRDIYGQGLTVRSVYEIQAVVRPATPAARSSSPTGRSSAWSSPARPPTATSATRWPPPGSCPGCTPSAIRLSATGTGPCIAG